MLLLYVLHNDIVHNLYTCVLCAIQLIIQGWRFRTLVVGSLVLMPALPLPPLRPALPPLCTTYWSLLLPPCHCMPTRLLLCLTSSAEWWIIIAYLLYLLYFNFYSNLSIIYLILPGESTGHALLFNTQSSQSSLQQQWRWWRRCWWFQHDGRPLHLYVATEHP